MQVLTRTIRSAASSVLSAQEYPGPERGEWFVLHTKSRQEKVVAESLAAMGVGYFLPLLHQVRYYGQRKFDVELPLFPSYVFLRGTRIAAFEANRVKRIAQIITVHNQPSLDWELSNLYQAIASGADLNPYPFLVAGTPVEVRSGPFRGLQGVVDSHARQNRLILQVHMLGRAVCLEVDAALLDPIDHSSCN